MCHALLYVELGRCQPKTNKSRSAIPDWARGKALAKILDKQYGGPNPLNPDKIFPEFFTCNLEHIFNTKKQKWDRSSRCVCEGGEACCTIAVK